MGQSDGDSARIDQCGQGPPDEERLIVKPIDLANGSELERWNDLEIYIDYEVYGVWPGNVQI